MSFLTTIPEELLAAATKLEGIGSSLTAQNAAAAAPTTTLAPAAADQVSIAQAGIFGTYGTLYQQFAAEAQTIQQQFLHTLGLSSGTYSETEALNAAQSTNPVANFLNSLNLLFGGSGSGTSNPLSLSGNTANFLNFESGNWASAMSDCLGMAGGGLLPAAASDTGDAAAAAGDAAAGAATASNVTPLAGLGGMGAMPMVGGMGMGQATMVGKLSVPPSWAGTFTTGASPATAVETVGWTGAAPQAAPGTFVPGVPGLASAARNSAGFGAPRYGVKPIVMPKLASV